MYSFVNAQVLQATVRRKKFRTLGLLHMSSLETFYRFINLFYFLRLNPSHCLLQLLRDNFNAVFL